MKPYKRADQSEGGRFGHKIMVRLGEAEINFCRWLKAKTGECRNSIIRRALKGLPEFKEFEKRDE